jgi:hypothetical protein
METFLVDSPPIKVDNMAWGENDDKILADTHRYLALKGRQSELLEQAEDRHISGSPGTVYLKRLGHRALSSEDFESIVNAVGSPEDKQTLVDFRTAQQRLQERLNNTRSIGLVLEQADIQRNLFYKRVERYDLWKPEEVVRIMEVVKRIQL